MSNSQNTMWGGRFAAGPDAIMQAINASISFDQRLAAQDITGSQAHAAMLAAQGIITDSDAAAIGKGLLTVLSEIEGGTFVFSAELEDIHMNVEARLRALIGTPAGGCTRRGRATIRWRWISGCGFGINAMRRSPGCKACKRRCWIRPRPGPIG